MLELPRRLTLQKVNWLYTFLIVGCGGVIGSATTVLFIGGLGWNLLALTTRRLALSVEPETRMTAAVFAAFFAAMTLSNIINHTLGQTAVETVKILPFLGFILFYASLARSTRQSIADAVQYGAIFGAYATFALVMFQYAVLGEARPAGMAGNPGPLAAITGFLYCLCFLTAVERDGRERLLALGAAGCAATILLLTGMRGLWPVLILGALIPFVIHGRSALTVRSKRAFAVGAILVVALAAISYDSVSGRISRVATDYRQITATGNFDNSIGHRLIIWSAGFDLIREKPLLGHGSVNIRHLMHERTQALGPVAVGYSHFHNFLINTAVRSGVVGLAALLAMMILPIGMALRRQRDETADFGLGMMLSLYATFVTSGMTNIMLHHDIMDTLFIFGSAVSCFLVFRNADNPADARRAGMA